MTDLTGFFQTYLESPRLLILDIVDLVLTGTEPLVNVYILSNIFDQYQKGNPQTTISYIGVFIFYLLLKGAYTLIYKYFSVKERSEVDARAKKRFVDRILDFDYFHLEKKESLNKISMVNSELISVYSDHMKTIKNSVAVFLQLMSLFFLFWRAIGYHAIAYILMLVIVVALVNYNAKKMISVHEKQAGAVRYLDYLKRVERDNNHAYERRIFSYSDALAQDYENKSEKLIKEKAAASMSNILRLEISDIPIAVILLYLIYFSLQSVRSGHTSFAYFASMFTQTLVFLELIRYDVAYYIDELISIYHYSRLNRDLDNFKTDSRLVECQNSDVSIPDIVAASDSALEFINVSFKYPGTERYILNNLSFTLLKNEIAMLVGENGSGKTTILKLILGLYNNYDGKILLFGQDLKRLSRKNRNSLLACMFQDYGRYYFTLEGNIYLGNSENKDVSDLIERFNLSEIPSNEPLRKLAGGTSDLSGGQWQRVALARLLHMDRPLYLLDEPTSALDPIEESKIYTATSRNLQNRTALIVSHRLGMAKAVDHILFLDEGEIVEEGSHEELLKAGQHYSRFYERQRSLYYAE